MRHGRSPDGHPGIFTVALTGGIASGKTVVSDQFARLGTPVIDTDRIAHEIVEPGRPALQQIREIFGSEYLDDFGCLDRQKMRRLIFKDARMRARLEALLHPLIAKEAVRQIKAVDYPYCLLVIPLYVESSRWPWVDRVLLVDVAESTQIARVMDRDGISRQQAQAILAAQAKRQERLVVADDVIDNSGNMEDLKVQVTALHSKYLSLATRKA